MRPSIRLPRQQRPKGGTNRFSGGSSHQALPEAKSLRRDDGPGQAVTRVVDTSSDVITLSAVWPTCSSMNPIRRRPRADPGQKPVPGEWITQKGIDSSRPVTEALARKLAVIMLRMLKDNAPFNPALQDAAVQNVLQQAEALSAEWAARVPAGNRFFGALPSLSE